MARKKETRAESLKRKYANLRNAGFSSVEANKYKHYGEDTILRELGVKVTKSTPVIKERPKDPKKLKSYLTRKERQRNKVIYGIEIGLKPKQAYKVKRYSNKRIKSTKEYKNQVEVSSRKYKTPKSQKARIELWEKWSKAESLPPEVHEIAREVNRKTYTGAIYRNGKLIKRGKRLDDTDKYGYMVAYYMFILGMEEEDVIAQNPVDAFSGNEYEDVLAELVA